MIKMRGMINEDDTKVALEFPQCGAHPDCDRICAVQLGPMLLRELI
jgi:hypothetical protein